MLVAERSAHDIQIQHMNHLRQAHQKIRTATAIHLSFPAITPKR
jgi:hypothetical protein